ncbi:MAG TPA: hypothetical protein VER83_01400 [Candidatus Nanopelagicales bacterium]|nr:hypothetical protein [Candidatus Nanopelagicales bacterium]
MLARAVRRPALVAALVVVALVVAACSAFTPQTPRPTATDFAGIVSELALVGVGVKNVTAGDPGCDDQRLARTAISFDASGADQAEPTRVYLYAFKNAKAYDELRPLVDLCARSYVVDPAAYSTVDATPYVLAGPGPWSPDFKDALGTALERAAVGG